MNDSEYRAYNCNIKCPNLKTIGLVTSSADISSYSPSGILTENGFLDYNNVFNIAPAALLLTNCVGELTVYIKNNGTLNVGVMMIIVTKAGGVITQSLPYQTVSNFATFALTNVSNTSVRITVSPYSTCSWVWRGI